jgi:hypothetical protein
MTNSIGLQLTFFLCAFAAWRKKSLRQSCCTLHGLCRTALQNVEGSDTTDDATCTTVDKQKAYCLQPLAVDDNIQTKAGRINMLYPAF